jgi:thiol-disulfide isomerase/thioredoxin
MMMKKLLFVFIFIIVFSLEAHSQITTVVTTQHKLDENTVVKDSAGVIYKYAEWQKLLRLGYILKAIDPGKDNTAFMLVKMDEGTKARMKIARQGMALQNGAPDNFKLGEKTSFFSAKAIDGYKIRPKELVGKVIVLNFWFIACRPCLDEMPELNKIAREYSNNPNIVFISVARDNKDDLERFLKDNPFAYHVVDEGKDIAEDFAVNNYPTNVIIDKEGKVRFRSVGYGPYKLEDFKKTIEEAK